MKTFISFLKESLLLEYKAWQQFIKQNGAKILERMGHKEKYISTSGEAGHGSEEHMTDYIKTHLGLSDFSEQHGNWVLKKFHAGHIPNTEDIPTSIATNLRKYEQLKNSGVTSVELKNINTPQELFAVVAKHDTKAMDERLGLEQGRDYDLLGENEHWKVYRPHNDTAACGLGRNTNWCTTSGLFAEYQRKGPLTIFIPKKPAYDGEKYQHHLESEQFMDYTDKDIHEVRPGPMFSTRPLPTLDSETTDRIQDGLIKDAFNDPNTDHDTLLRYLNHPVVNKRPEYYYPKALRSSNETVALRTLDEMDRRRLSPIHYESGLLNQHDSVTTATLNKLLSFGQSEDEIFRDHNLIKSKNKNIAQRAFDTVKQFSLDGESKPTGELAAKLSKIIPEIHHEDLAHSALDEIEASAKGISIISQLRNNQNSKHESVAKRSLNILMGIRPSEDHKFHRDLAISNYLYSPHKSVAIDAANAIIPNLKTNKAQPDIITWGLGINSNHASVAKLFFDSGIAQEAMKQSVGTRVPVIQHVGNSKHVDLARKFFADNIHHISIREIPHIIAGGEHSRVADALVKDIFDKHLDKMINNQPNSNIFVPSVTRSLFFGASEHSKIPEYLINSKHFDISHVVHSDMFQPSTRYGDENKYKTRQISLINSKHMTPELLKRAVVSTDRDVQRAAINSPLMSQEIFDDVLKTQRGYADSSVLDDLETEYTNAMHRRVTQQG
jgi:hypothetical protein